MSEKDLAAKLTLALIRDGRVKHHEYNSTSQLIRSFLKDRNDLMRCTICGLIVDLSFKAEFKNEADRNKTPKATSVPVVRRTTDDPFG